MTKCQILSKCYFGKTNQLVKAAVLIDNKSMSCLCLMYLYLYNVLSQFLLVDLRAEFNHPETFTHPHTKHNWMLSQKNERKNEGLLEPLGRVYIRRAGRLSCGADSNWHMKFETITRSDTVLSIGPASCASQVTCCVS